MRFSWHGSGCFTLSVDDIQFLVDPYFSPEGVYGDWYLPNPHAPRLEDYVKEYSPSYVLITHGHYDHFDLEAVRFIDSHHLPKYVTSRDGTEALAHYLNIPESRLLPISPGNTLSLEETSGIGVTAFEGIHWLTGDEGTEIAKRLARKPNRYGVMPCGGPAFGFLIESTRESVYISGDTKLAGVPPIKVDVGIINVGGPMLNPYTREESFPGITEHDVPALLSRFSPRLFVPIHYDFPSFTRPFDLKKLEENVRLAGYPILFPPYNRWIELEPPRPAGDG